MKVVLPMAEFKVHADKVDIEASLVRRLVVTQFPQWADLPDQAG
jgi:hypothetical protein